MIKSMAVVLVALAASVVHPAPNDRIALALADDVRPIIFGYSPDLSSHELWAMRPDGSGRRRLTERATGPFQWAPNGRKIAFVRERCPTRSDCDAYIYLINPDGSGVSRLTGNADHIQSFDWSPDSRQVVYSFFDDETNDFGLRIATRGVRQPAVLTNDPDSYELEPSWSPDGSRIAFTRQGPNAKDIYTIAPDGTGEQNLTVDEHLDSNPVWSPDGQWLAFATSRDDTTVGEDAPYTDQVYVMRPDGSEPTRMSSNESTLKRAVAWSPDSTQLAWEEDCDQDYCSGDSDVWTAVIGGTARNVTDDKRFFDSSPEWSLDGERLLFTRWLRTSSRTDMYRIRIDGTGLKRLSDTPGPENSPDWRPR